MCLNVRPVRQQARCVLLPAPAAPLMELIIWSTYAENEQVPKILYAWKATQSVMDNLNLNRSGCNETGIL